MARKIKTHRMVMTPIMSLAVFALFAMMIPIITLSNSSNKTSKTSAAVSSPTPMATDAEMYFK